MAESGCDEKGVPSDAVVAWVTGVFEPAVRVIASVFTECGLPAKAAEHNARACLARLMQHDPPISVEFLKEG